MNEVNIWESPRPTTFLLTPHPKDVIKEDYYTIGAIVALKRFNKYFYVVVHGAYVLFLVAVIAGVAPETLLRKAKLEGDYRKLYEGNHGED
mgnify:CR=1 FL=1